MQKARKGLWGRVADCLKPIARCKTGLESGKLETQKISGLLDLQISCIHAASVQCNEPACQTYRARGIPAQLHFKWHPCTTQNQLQVASLAGISTLSMNY
jgi:hypothetical protein